LVIFSLIFVNFCSTLYLFLEYKLNKCNSFRACAILGMGMMITLMDMDMDMNMRY